MDKLVRTKWAQLDWENGPLGYPTTPTQTHNRASSCHIDNVTIRFKPFEKGRIYWTEVTGQLAQTKGPYAELEPILTKHLSLSYSDSIIPASDTLTTPDKIGYYSHFVTDDNCSPNARPGDRLDLFRSWLPCSEQWRETRRRKAIRYKTLSQRIVR
jgi:hypothetical protein